MVIAGFCIAAWQICVNASKFPGPVANLWVLLISALIALLTVTKIISIGQLGLLSGFTAASFVTVVVVFRGNVPEDVAAYMFMTAAGLLSGRSNRNRGGLSPRRAVARPGNRQRKDNCCVRNSGDGRVAPATITDETKKRYRRASALRREP